MDDLNLWELVNEHLEVFEAHKLRDSEREPYVEKPTPRLTTYLPPRYEWPSNNHYTTY